MADREGKTLTEEQTLIFICDCLVQIPITHKSSSSNEFSVNYQSFSSSDWDRILSIATEQEITPLLYWFLSKSRDYGNIPQTVRDSLRKKFTITWINNQRLIKQLEILTRLFFENEIPVVALKGICSVLTIYPDIGLRPMIDMDLLIPGDRMNRAISIAKPLGYEDNVPDAFPCQKKLLKAEVALYKAGACPINLELHESLVANNAFSFYAPAEWFWDQTEQIHGSTFKEFDNLLMLTPTAQILHVAAHAILVHGNSNSTLRWVYDLDRLIRHYPDRIDWDLLLQQAKVFEWGSALSKALTQTRNYFNTPIPGNTLMDISQIKDRHLKWISFHEQEQKTHLLEELQDLKVLKWYGKVIRIVGLIFPTPAYMRWRYRLKSPWFIPAYYFMRWWGIIKDGFRSMKYLTHKT